MPKIIIVIPSCGNFDNLKNCLDSISRNTDMEKYDIEVIVSINGGDIKSIDYIRSLGKRFRFIWVDKRIGICLASNLALSICEYDYVIRMDDDVMILDYGKNIWVDLLLKPFQEDDKVGQTGVVVYDYITTTGETYKTAVGFLTMTKKQAYLTVGGWDMQYNSGSYNNVGEDTKFSIDIQKNGYSVVCVMDYQSYDYKKTGYSYGSPFPVYHISTGIWINHPLEYKSL